MKSLSQAEQFLLLKKRQEINRRLKSISNLTILSNVLLWACFFVEGVMFADDIWNKNIYGGGLIFVTLCLLVSAVIFYWVAIPNQRKRLNELGGFRE